MNNDLISRSALKEIWELYEKYQPSLATNVYEFGAALKGIIDNAPSVEPISVDEYRNKLIGLFHETGHDELITFICLPTETDYKILRDILLQYKFEPQRPKGEWIADTSHCYDDDEDTFECSVCKEPFTLICGTPKDNLYNFCPNCGADMRGGGDK